VKKIAPNLTELVEAYNGVKTVSGRNPTGVALRAEHSALLAVASAAQTVAIRYQTHLHRHQNRRDDVLVRALDRLERASKGGKP
jgi:hypothetical protein